MTEASTYLHNKRSLSAGQIKFLVEGKEYMRGVQNAFWIGYQ
jgi:hypothetical protein